MAKEKKAATIGEMAQAIVELDPRGAKDAKGNPIQPYSVFADDFKGKLNDKFKLSVEEFKGLSDDVKDAAHDFVKLQKELGNKIVETDGVFAAKEGVDLGDDAAKLARLNESHSLLQGQKGSADKIAGLGKALKGMTGMVQTEGLVGAAVKNLNPKNGPVAFARMGATALCAVGAVNGITNSKTKDGEDRSILMRGGQIAIFTLGTAAALLLGRAHLQNATKAAAAIS
ncbi:MAG: hypothetical protein J0M34_00905 [Alphaproteobacteria bacterium]|nr:hypothetical protein [Alphaproteobacteria bacterium]